MTLEKKLPPYSSENPDWRKKVYENGLVFPSTKGYWIIALELPYHSFDKTTLSCEVFKSLGYHTTWN
jgi:hypothetical protein